MSTVTPPPYIEPEPPLPQTLRKLFLTLFLRGRSSRGLQQGKAPQSIARKLWLSLLFYALFGAMALMLLGQPVFTLSVYLHCMTFVFLGMFVAASAGEILFNKEEADILMHRPITPGALLWAKIRVLIEVSLWLAVAFNLAGFFAGLGSRNGGWLFPPIHAVSVMMSALFCTSCVVLVYQLCLRFFGRERLENLMTLAQVFVAIASVMAGQFLPHIMPRIGKGSLELDSSAWWLAILPPVWFAGLDDAVAGSHAAMSWLLAAAGLLATIITCWLAFGKLAESYQSGLQNLQEAAAPKAKSRGRRRWLSILVEKPPLRWWLRDPVEKASFLLTAAYLFRDRDVKLRIYPGLAPILIVPFFIMLRDSHQGDASSFAVAFSCGMVGLVPVMAGGIMAYSQQWQAGDLFRVMPAQGPGPLCFGSQRALLLVLVVPAYLLLGGMVTVMRPQALPLLLPSLIAVPVISLVPYLRGKAIPLSLPPEEAKNAGRGLGIMGIMILSMALSAGAGFAWKAGWLYWLLLIEAMIVGGMWLVCRKMVQNAKWPSME
jgi:hypothetical protein